MGLLHTFKKLLHNTDDSAPITEQTLPHKHNTLTTLTFPNEPCDDNPSPDMVPLNMRLKNAVPTKRGLYPHEILMLDYAHTYSTDLENQKFQGFWYYEYSVEHPADVLKSLVRRGFIKPGDLRSAIERKTITEIKKELKEIGQKVNGKKADLIDRLLHNAPQNVLENKFPVRFYGLTETGQQELAENEYVPYLHSHRYMSVWEMNYRLNNRNPRHLGYRDLIWQYFNEESTKDINEGHMGSYRCVRLNMYKFAFEAKKYDLAFDLLCEVIAYDLSGMNDHEFDDDEMFRLAHLLKYGFSYEQSRAKIPSAIPLWLLNLQGRLELCDEALRERLLEQFESISLYRRIFTNEECVDIVMAELDDDTQTLNTIYAKAENRLRKQLQSL